MIVRTVKNKENPYYLKNRTAPNDPRLTWKAKGVHDYLMSKPDHWEAIIKELIAASADGEEAVRSAINELIKFGYMHRAREINELGRVIRWRLDAYEAPEMNPYFVANEPHPAFPDVAEPDLAYPHLGNQALVINDLGVSNERSVSNEKRVSNGGQRVQDLPSPAQTQLPPQTALPVKVDEPNHVQPVQQQQAKPYDFQSGLPQPKRGQEKRKIDVQVQEAKNLEISPANFRLMVDALLDASKNLAFVNAQPADREDPDAVKILNEHRDAILFVAGLSENYRTPEAVKSIIADFLRENKGFSQIYPKQFKIHAANLLSKPALVSSTRTSDEQADKAFYLAGGTLVDAGPKYQFTERKVKPGTGRMDPKTCKWIEAVYLDEEPAVETQKAA